MDRRPDYVPRLWLRGPINHRFWESPQRVFVFLVVMVPVSLGVTVLEFVAGNVVWGAILAVSSTIGGVQSAIYAPRARRAARLRVEHREDSDR